MDRSRLVGGQAWPVGLQQAVESSDLMLVLLSPHSLASDYVRREYLHALSLGKTVIPVLLAAVPAFPDELRHLQWVDLTQRDNQGYLDLLLALDSRGWTLAKADGFDWELILAKATRNQLPADSHAFWVQNRDWYRQPTIRFALAAPLAIIVERIIADAVQLSPLIPPDAAFPVLLALDVLGVIAIAIAIIFGLKAIQWGWHWAGKGSPEMIVTTPLGIFVRLLAGRTLGSRSIAIPFQRVTQLRTIRLRDGSSAMVRVEYKGTRTITQVKIARRFTITGTITKQMMSDIRAYLQAHGIATTAPAS